MTRFAAKVRAAAAAPATVKLLTSVKGDVA